MDRLRLWREYPAMDERDLIGVGMVVAKAMVLALAYAMPAMLATWWRQRGQERIALLNLTLGWTGIGWLVLMAYVVLRRIRAFARAKLALSVPRCGTDRASAASGWANCRVHGRQSGRNRFAAMKPAAELS